MKTLSTTMLTLAAFLTFNQVQASPPADPLRSESSDTRSRELRKQIDRFVTYPLFGRKPVMDGAVEVNFTINAEGRVQVISANGTSEELRGYVLSKLAKVDVGDNPTGTWRIERMRFVFHPEA